MTKQPRPPGAILDHSAATTADTVLAADPAASKDNTSTITTLAANAGIDGMRTTAAGEPGSSSTAIMERTPDTPLNDTTEIEAEEDESEPPDEPEHAQDVKPDEKPKTDDTSVAKPQVPLPVDDPTLKLIREEIQRAVDLKPGDPREFGFKVSTVKWFGILCAIVVLLLIVLDFVFIDKIITASGPPTPQMNVGTVIGGQPPVSDRLLQLGIENEALALRNKRTVGALYMRAYTQFLSITAGAILAMLGAIFVLARVDSRETRSEASLLEFRWLINTASPGILLAGLGVLLVGYVAYLSITEIRTTDLPVFSPIVAGTAGGSTLTGYLNSEAFQKQMDEDLGRTGPEE
jgi:hypothetical protein